MLLLVAAMVVSAVFGNPACSSYACASSYASSYSYAAGYASAPASACSCVVLALRQRGNGEDMVKE